MNIDLLHIVFLNIVHDDLRVILVFGFAGSEHGIQKRKLADDTKNLGLHGKGLVSGIAHQCKHLRWNGEHGRQIGETMGLRSREANPTEAPWIVWVGKPVCIAGGMEEKRLPFFQVICLSVNDHRSVSAGDIVDQDITATVRVGTILQRWGRVTEQNRIDIPHLSGKSDLYG